MEPISTLVRGMTELWLVELRDVYVGLNENDWKIAKDIRGVSGEDGP